MCDAIDAIQYLNIAEARASKATNLEQRVHSEPSRPTSERRCVERVPDRKDNLQDALEPGRVLELLRGGSESLQVWNDLGDIKLESTAEEHAVKAFDKAGDGHDLR